MRARGHLALLVLLAPLAAVTSCHSHDPNAVEIANADCVVCHRADYEGTTDPVHPGAMPETCGECHSTVAWRPAVGGAHPESRFPTTGPHDVACLDCHDPALGSSAGGANTDCVGCHTGDHSRAKMDDKHHEEPGYAFDAANPHFCLECHPRGRN